MSELTPGLHAMSNDDYHATTDWWSSTQLKRFLPEYTEPDDQAALEFGSLFHTVVLEPERLQDDYLVLDPYEIGVTKDGKPSSNPLVTTAWKGALAEAAASGKTVVSPSNWDKARRMAHSVHEHHDAARLMFGAGGTYEESAFWIDDDGIRHKARFDRRLPGAIVDLKSTSTAMTDDKLAAATFDYLYHLSAAHYLTVAQGLGLGVDTFAFVFVSKHAPYHVKVVDLDVDFLARGYDKRGEALDLAVNGQRGFSTLHLPRWAA